MNIQATRIGITVVALLLALACVMKSEATFHLKYFNAKDLDTPATVFIDNRFVFQVKNGPFTFEEYSTKLRPGLHTFVVRQGKTVLTARFVYLHFNANIVEYSSGERDNACVWGITPHVGKFLPD